VRFDVTLPLIRNGILAGWVLIFLIFVREYSTGVYLLAPGTQVIGPCGARAQWTSFRLCRLSMWASSARVF
jgi:ABC-type spermidine/putrescine transport system permease subunit I